MTISMTREEHGDVQVGPLSAGFEHPGDVRVIEALRDLSLVFDEAQSLRSESRTASLRQDLEHHAPAGFLAGGEKEPADRRSPQFPLDPEGADLLGEFSQIARGRNKGCAKSTLSKEL